MTTSLQQVSEADAGALLERLYGFKGSAERLDGEYDLNFRITSEEGVFVLKVTRPGHALADLELQHAALKHLKENAPDLNVPRVHPAFSGKDTETVELEGETRYVRLLSHLSGDLLVHVKPHSPDLLNGVGRLLGKFSAAIADFEHPAAERELSWDLPQALWVNDHWHHIEGEARLELVQKVLRRFEEETLPALEGLRRSVIHGDANDYNVLVSEPQNLPRRAVGLIDFGDMLKSYTVCDVAVAAAYAMLDKRDPVGAAAQLIKGYHAVCPLTESELAVLDSLVRTRLCLSVTTSARRRVLEPGNAYHGVSEAPAWRLLEQLETVPPNLAHYRYRAACGLPPVPHGERVVAWLNAHQAELYPVIDADLKDAAVFDLSVGSLDFPDIATFKDTNALTKRLKNLQGDAEVGVGRYNEARLLYTSDAFKTLGETGPERRTLHLGLDLFTEAGTPVYAPLNGTVHSVQVRPDPLDYGGCVVLEHTVSETVSDEAGDLTFYSLYGHLSPDSVAALTVGQHVSKGERVAKLGDADANGGWPPHLHLQLITDDLGLGDAFPGVAPPSQRETWLSLSPDANLLALVPQNRFPQPPLSGPEIAARRRESIGYNLSLTYQNPLTFVRGAGQYLYDENGRRYLDAYNNVPHVGHAHPRVVEAAARQMALLNTNTRYLHENLVRYAERLTATLPEPLRVCFFVNSGSEATELALRLARAHTGQGDLIISEGAYHGHTTTLVDISPYKAETAGGRGLAPWVHKAAVPDDYRGAYRRGERDIGLNYARGLEPLIETIQTEGRGLCGFMLESILSCGGQIILPEGYLKEAYKRVRAAGGVCIADEVQVGFGRVGAHFWAFELQGVVPDIVALGKPIGNGHPLGAVVTTPEIAASFDNGMEWFSTFGGNPVSCAVGLAVLDVIEEEGLQENALEVGAYLLEALRGLMREHPLIGDVRGAGLFIGIELVRDKETLEPAAAETAYLVNRLREYGVLTGTDGIYHNVLKIKPPLPFSYSDAEYFVGVVSEILGSKQSGFNDQV